MMPSRLWISVLGVSAALGVGVWIWLSDAQTSESGADPDNREIVALGKSVYAKHCAACHGIALEGEKNWRQARADGSLRAPPHDASGHTWHHPDRVLFRITKKGGASVAPAGFKSNMPGFEGQLSDREIWAVLVFIKSRWPARVREIHARINARSAGH